MSVQNICDCCDRRPATYHIQEKARAVRWFFYESSWKEKYVLCEDCWTTIGALVRGDPRAEVKRLFPKHPSTSSRERQI